METEKGINRVPGNPDDKRYLIMNKKRYLQDTIKERQVCDQVKYVDSKR